MHTKNEIYLSAQKPLTVFVTPVLLKYMTI